MSNTKPTHGGKRKGAGRKPRPEPQRKPLVAITMKLNPELARKWNARKKAEKLSGPKMLERLLAQTSPPVS